MAKKKKTEDSGPDMSWMVTFCDCMTLLLCFFVLLMTFSSFDEIKYVQMAGAFKTLGNTSIEDNARRQKTSMTVPPPRPTMTSKGSEISTDIMPSAENPRKPVEIDIDADKDRTTFYLPSKRFFWAKGTSMTADGRKYLAMLAGYLHKMPCRVVIGESSPNGQNLQLRRGWMILEYFTNVEGLRADRFSIATSNHSSFRRFGGQPFVKITLMNIRIEE